MEIRNWFAHRLEVRTLDEPTLQPLLEKLGERSRKATARDHWMGWVLTIWAGLEAPQADPAPVDDPDAEPKKAGGHKSERGKRRRP